MRDPSFLSRHDDPTPLASPRRPPQAINRQPNIYFRGAPIPKAVQNILNIRGPGIWPPRPIEIRKPATVSVDIGADVRSLLAGDADAAARANIPPLENTRLRSDSPPTKPGEEPRPRSTAPLHLPPSPPGIVETPKRSGALRAGKARRSPPPRPWECPAAGSSDDFRTELLQSQLSTKARLRQNQLPPSPPRDPQRAAAELSCLSPLLRNLQTKQENLNVNVLNVVNQTNTSSRTVDLGLMAPRVRAASHALNQPRFCGVRGLRRAASLTCFYRPVRSRRGTPSRT